MLVVMRNFELVEMSFTKFGSFVIGSTIDILPLILRKHIIKLCHSIKGRGAVMSIWMIILKIALIVLCGVGIYYLFIFSTFFWGISEAVCKVVETGTDVVGRPFRLLWDFVKEKLGLSVFFRRRGAIARFADRHPSLGTATSIRFFLFSFVFLCVATTVSVLTDKFKNAFDSMMSMFPFVFIFDVFSGEANFSIVGLISTGISAMLIGAFFNYCMNGYSRKGHFLRWLVSIIYYIITTLLACSLGLILSNVWEWFGVKGVALFNVFKNAISNSGMSFGGVLTVIGSVLGLLAILYIGIILMLIAVREYIETFCYGILGVALFFVVGILCLVIGSQEFINGPWGNAIMTATLLICIFAFDFIRVNKGELLDVDEIF